MCGGVGGVEVWSCGGVGGVGDVGGVEVWRCRRWKSCGVMEV